MTEFLKERIGEHEYKAPRRDGNQQLVIDEALIEVGSMADAEYILAPGVYVCGGKKYVIK